MKSTKIITFINAGVSKDYFTQQDMEKNGMVTLKPGIALLDAFGLDNALFCSVFNHYGSGRKFAIVDVKPDKSKLENFMQLQSANYHMIHELQGSVYYWFVGDAEK